MKTKIFTHIPACAEMIVCLLLLTLTSCSESPEGAVRTNTQPRIFPDYSGVTIPAGIAPLNFNIVADINEEVDVVDVTVRGSKSGEIHVNGAYADFDIDEWHAITEANRGGHLTVTVCAKQGDKWLQYDDFKIFVSPYPLEEWGITYRRIKPGYEVYSKMGIYQREIATFSETAIFENTSVPGACVNCHTSNRTNPDRFTFHVRGGHGATLIQQDGKREWLKARNDSIRGSMVYPYWHPSGEYCAYSTNMTHQSFHTVASERIEVFDQSSDVFVYHPATHSLILDTLLSTKSHYETYPVFSPDGKTMYFCSSEAKPIPSGYKEIRYDICQIAFDAEKGRFGDRVDTIFHASRMGKSATHPRPSYDGKYLMFTVADYGCFPIWHKEADNWLLDLTTNETRPLELANSKDTDSWHNWSTNSHWFVFTSRRGDGLHTRLYLSSIDENGNATKPFLLPQRNPWEYYDRLADSFNTPDFTSREVEFDWRQAGAEILSDKRTETEVRD